MAMIYEKTTFKLEEIKMDEKRRLYVAYGSNLNLEQMAIRCPTAKVEGAIMLRNWRLAFKDSVVIRYIWRAGACMVHNINHCANSFAV